MKTFIYIVLIFCAVSSAAASEIKGYTIVSPLSGIGENIAIRSFYKDGRRYFITVNPFSFESFQQESSEGVLPLTEKQKSSPYIKLIDELSKSKQRLQNFGITHSLSKAEGYFLTVDLCPSKKNLDRRIFNILLSKSGLKTVPVAIAITGKWLESHPDDFAWIRSLSENGKIAVTWVNHSYNHPYRGNIPIYKDFLLSEGVDFQKELLKTEELLLTSGAIPSPFFRFPGLVSDERLVRQLTEYGLIPLGSDAWLAKGEEPREGSIILVHGNGNEPAGVERLLALVSESGISSRLLRIEKAALRSSE